MLCVKRGASSTIFWVFDMTQPGIESQVSSLYYANVRYYTNVRYTCIITLKENGFRIK